MRKTKFSNLFNWPFQSASKQIGSKGVKMKKPVPQRSTMGGKWQKKKERGDWQVVIKLEPRNLEAFLAWSPAIDPTVWFCC